MDAFTDITMGQIVDCCKPAKDGKTMLSGSRLTTIAHVSHTPTTGPMHRWHSNTPQCKDYSEEYQALYHEYMAQVAPLPALL